MASRNNRRYRRHYFKKGLKKAVKKELSGLDRALEIIKVLTNDMEKWGRWEEGIPVAFYKDYREAKTFIGEAVDEKYCVR